METELQQLALRQARRFNLPGPVISLRPFGTGHINDTFLVEAHGGKWVLQRISAAFPHPEEVMANVAGVIRHLKRRPGRVFPSLVETREGKICAFDEAGSCWRVLDYIADTQTYELPESPELFRQAALAFGDFQLALADYPAHTLYETLPRFHDTPHRIAQLEAAMSLDSAGRLALCREETAFALSRRERAGKLQALRQSGLLPLRVTHNDTKLNNVLMDEAGRAVCVVDLDTVMPGLSAYDFGDAVRFGANTALEDETNLTQVDFSLAMFRAYAQGYLSKTLPVLTPLEVETLPLGAWTMTYECGIRFLADHLNGDTYFHIDYAGHNLVRARNQFKLLAEMERKEEAMAQIIREVAGGLQ